MGGGGRIGNPGWDDPKCGKEGKVAWGQRDPLQGKGVERV